MSNVLTTTTLSGNQWDFYNKTLLKSAESNLRFWGLGQKTIHPKKMGSDMYVLRYGHITPNTDAVTQGVVPTSSQIATHKYTITLNEYIQWLTLSDTLVFEGVDDTLKNVAEKLGYTAAKATDSIIRDNLIANATTSLQYAGTGNTADNDFTDLSTTMVAQDALKVTPLLANADAPMFDNDAYVWVVPPAVAYDIKGDTSAGGWVDLNKYVTNLTSGKMNGEKGMAYDARIIQSTNLNAASYADGIANSSTINVYRTFILAKDAFVCSSFDRDHVKMIIKQLGSGGTSDPGDQIATVAYKMYFGVKYTGGSFTDHNGASPDTCIQLRSPASIG